MCIDWSQSLLGQYSNCLMAKNFNSLRNLPTKKISPIDAEDIIGFIFQPWVFHHIRKVLKCVKVIKRYTERYSIYFIVDGEP